MIQIVLNLTGISDTDVESRLSALAAAQTANPTAATGLTITPAMLTASAALIDGKLSAQATADAAAIAATKNKDDAVEAGKQLIRDYAAQVLPGTGKDPAKITLLGFTAKDTSIAPAPAPAVVQPQAVSLTVGTMPGSLNAKCNADPNASTYEWQTTTTDPINGPYVTATHSTAAHATITGLTSGSRVWVRVRAIGTHGEGPWSNPADKIVP